MNHPGGGNSRKRYRYLGKRLRWHELCLLAVVNEETLRKRLQNGWPVWKAVETPRYYRRKRLVAMKTIPWEAFAGSKTARSRKRSSVYAATPEPLGLNTVHKRRHDGLGMLVSPKRAMYVADVRKTIGIPLRIGVKMRRR